MKQTPDSAGGSMFAKAHDTSIDGRIFRSMALATALVVIGSLPLAQWRVTTGLLLGGVLSLLNHHWLSGSTAAAFSVLAHGATPRLKLAQYILRYFVIATVVFAAYQLKVVSLAATLVGLSSFVVALFAEAFREFYLAFIHREEIS
jgi:ATP synthase I subunit